MTIVRQDGRFGRFEHSFHDVVEEILIVAAAEAESASMLRRPPRRTLMELLFRRPAGDQPVLH